MALLGCELLFPIGAQIDRANLGFTMAFQFDDDPRLEDLVRALITWLQNWRAAPRERSKTADWAMVVLTLLAAIAAICSAIIFQGQPKEARRATEAAQE